MTGQLALWGPEPCDTAPAPRPTPATNPHKLTRLTDTELADLYRRLTAVLANAPWPDENHTRANTATRLGHVEREMQRRGIWWTHQPTTAPAPAVTRDEYATWLHAPAEHAVPPDAGRAAGRGRLSWKPVTDMRPEARYL